MGSAQYKIGAALKARVKMRNEPEAGGHGITTARLKQTNTKKKTPTKETNKNIWIT